jgi:formylglycine-generating enzyme required for sulfatase activity
MPSANAEIEFMKYAQNYTTPVIFCLLVLTGAWLGACGPGKARKNGSVFVSPIDGKEMVLVPAGEFIMGTDKIDAENTHIRIGAVKPLFMDQHPQRKVFLPAYHIDRYEVTNKEYKRFVEATQYAAYPPHWTDGDFPEGEENHPVRNVSWSDALAYALWAQKSLPTEAQWEKAARGTDGRLYPWGNEYRKGQANIEIDGARKTAPVGGYPQDVSPYQVFDMEGNVMEWTLDWYRPYPANDWQSPRFGAAFKVLRGNGYQKAGHYFLEAYRYVFHRTEAEPDGFFENVGFRCVREVVTK